MQFIRNPEVRWVCWPNLLIGVLASVLVYACAQHGMPPIMLALLAAAAFALTAIVFLIVSAVHSKKVVRFTAQIDSNLHGTKDLQFCEFREGDFQKLQCVVSNMVDVHFRQEDLLQEEKERLVDELAMIMHEIRTPLLTISMTTEQMADENIDPKERRSMARRTLNLVDRIKIFVSTLLRLSRLEANVVEFKHETFSARELIRDAVYPMELTMELREQELVTNIPEDITVEGDKFWLTDALVNVIKNCVEHTPDGGKIYIDVSENAATTCIVIRDTGPGIPPEDCQKIFERYHKGSDSGTDSIGIGLTFTRRVIHDMNRDKGLGGTIWADNHPDGGARFTINLDKIIV